MSVPPTFQGEVMLAGWSESHNGGAKVTFWLADPSELDAFRAMTVAKGKVAGQRLAMVLVEIGDDEQPKEPAVLPEQKGGPLAKLAGRLCADPAFCSWLRQRKAGEWEYHIGRNEKAVPDSEVAARVIRYSCGIDSRAELDHDEIAAGLFHDKFRKPWLEFNGGKA